MKAIEGKTQVEGLILEDGSRLGVQGVFIELGAKGAMELATRLGVNLDTETFQYVVTNKKQEETVLQGAFCGRRPHRAALADGQGRGGRMRCRPGSRRLHKKHRPIG